MERKTRLYDIYRLKQPVDNQKKEGHLVELVTVSQSYLARKGNIPRYRDSTHFFLKKS